MNNQAPLHVPVMLPEVLKALSPQKGEVYVDGTFGGGGYSQAILEHADCTVYAIDKDPEAIERGHLLEQKFKNFQILEGDFSEMEGLLHRHKIKEVDGVVLDLGVSSPQLDQAKRGFSFQKEGPLDMRMTQKGPTAADLLNTLSEKELARIIWTYGDEPHSRAIAREIAHHRKAESFKTTLQLTSLIHKICGKRGSQKIDSATKTFQALRIYVNQEIESLEQGLLAAERILNPKGRLVVVSFHSLEDQPVKSFFQTRSGKKKGTSRYQPSPPSPFKDQDPSFVLINKNALLPSDAEIKKNPRSRSAKLRWGVRTQSKAWESDKEKGGEL